MNNSIKMVSPFVLYCQKVIPLAFDESMSYYECLCALYSYLKDTVVPAVNNNAEALEEVQKAMLELKEYVDTYFENLDVQEEINNKLDDMVTQGTMAEIINQEIFGELDDRITTDEGLIQGNSDEIIRVEQKVDANETSSHQQPYYDILENGGDATGTTPVDSLITTASFVSFCGK